MYQLANHLGQPLSVVLDMTVDEYNHWFTFIKIKTERENRHVKSPSNSSR